MNEEKLNNYLCKKAAENWIKNGGGWALFVINIIPIPISVFIEEKCIGLTILSSMAETWWRGGGPINHSWKMPIKFVKL